MADNQQETGSEPPQQSFTANALADYIRRLFHVESGGNPNAVTGSNRGYGQFGPAEERKYGITAANRGDYGAQANAVVREYAENNARLARVLGRAPTFADHYFTHQQGSAGGPALLSADPQTPAWQVIRPFYSSYEGRRSGGVPRSADWWAQKAITGNIPSDSPLAKLPVDQISAGGMTGLWRDRFNRGLTRVGLSGEAPPVPAEAGPVSPALQNAMQPQGNALQSQGNQAAQTAIPPPSTSAPQSSLLPPAGGVQSLLAGLGSSDNKGTGTFGDIGKSLMTAAGKTKGLPFPDAKLKPFDENLRPLPFNLSNFAAMAQIPKFAEGGIVDRPTVAMVGEDGPEAIVPLSRNAGGPYSYLGMLEQAGRFMPPVDLSGQAPSTNIIRDTVDPFERAAARTRAPYAHANERVSGLLEFLDHLRNRMIHSGTGFDRSRLQR
jgi:hypothetical protein